MDLDSKISSARSAQEALRTELASLRASLSARAPAQPPPPPPRPSALASPAARCALLATLLTLLCLWLQSSLSTLPSAAPQHLHDLNSGRASRASLAAQHPPPPPVDAEPAPTSPAAAALTSPTPSTTPPPPPSPSQPLPIPAIPPPPPYAAPDAPAPSPSRTPARTRHPAPPSSPPGSAPRAKSAALVYFGNVGATHYEAKDAMLAGRAAWRMDAAAGARPYIAEHVLAFNAARGWTFDAFLHTWNDGLQAELQALLAPLTNASFGVQPLRGRPAAPSMEASIDLALQLVAAHTAAARGGVPYDRLLVLRLDSIFYRGFDLDALAEGDAVYVASWCKANKERPLAADAWPPGVLGCWELAPYWADLEGVPDFWFAGAQAPLLRAFEHLAEDLASGAVVAGRTCSGCGHAKVWGALNGHAVKTRRYGFHQIDNDLYRDKVCGEKFKNYTGPPGNPWVRHASGDTPGTADSLCKGHVCTVLAEEARACAVVKPDGDDRDRHGPPPPYPLGAPKTGEGAAAAGR